MPLPPLTYTDRVEALTTLDPTVRASSFTLLREPSTWAALVALVGSTVALAGTLSWLGWESLLNTSTGPIPMPPLLASWGPPSGDLLATLSLFGVYRLLETRSWAAMAGGVLLLLRLAPSLLHPLFGVRVAGTSTRLRRAALRLLSIAPSLTLARARGDVTVGS